MKKIILISAATLFIGLTAFAAFAKDDDKCAKNCDKKCDQKEFMTDGTFDKQWGISVCKKNIEKKDGKAGDIKDTVKPKVLPVQRPRLYFVIPMADSAPVDTTQGC